MRRRGRPGEALHRSRRTSRERPERSSSAGSSSTSDFHRSVDARATTEREHRRLIEKLPLVVYVNTLSGTGLGEGRRTSYISPQVQQLFGYPPSAWFADDILWDKLVHPDDLPLVREAEIRADGGPFECEYRIVRPDGTIRWVLDAMYTENDDAGTPLFEQGFIFDVTDRKRPSSRSSRRSSAPRERAAVSRRLRQCLRRDGARGRRQVATST